MRFEGSPGTSSTSPPSPPLHLLLPNLAEPLEGLTQESGVEVRDSRGLKDLPIPDPADLGRSKKEE